MLTMTSVTINMKARKVTDDVYEVGYIDWDRDIFEDLEPLPTGTSYNSYFIKGSEKVALIDTVDEGKFEALKYKLDSIGVTKIDYVIANHAEQDHSSCLSLVLKTYPDAKLVCNSKAKELLQAHMHELKDYEDRFIIIKDKEELSLGDKTLQFIFMPWVHWPETMVTYLKEKNILFTCDFFGAHITSNELFFNDVRGHYTMMRAYYAAVLMPFRTNMRNHFKKLEDMGITPSYICPSHGQCYKDEAVPYIMNLYREWNSEKVRNLVVIPYSTTHGNVEKMVNYLTECLTDRGIGVKPFHISRMDINAIASSLVDAATVVVASPTYLGGLHPGVVFSAYITNILRPKVKYISLLGTYGWATRLVENVVSLLTNIKPEILDPVISQGSPSEKEFKQIEKMAETIAAKHAKLREDGLLLEEKAKLI